MKTENNTQKQTQKRREFNANVIAEMITRFLIKYGRLILIISSGIIVIIVSVLIYFAWVESYDKDINTKLEQGIAAYMRTANSQSEEESMRYTAIASDLFREVMDSAKGNDLKLRATYELASLLFDMKNHLEAGRLFANVAKKRNFYLAEPSLYNRGITQIELKKYDNAVETFNTFMKVYPKSYLLPEATLSLANTLYITQGKDKEAIEVLKNWLGKNTNENQYTEIFQENISLIENKIY